MNAHWPDKNRPNVQPTNDAAIQVLSEIRIAVRLERDSQEPKVIESELKA